MPEKIIEAGKKVVAEILSYGFRITFAKNTRGYVFWSLQTCYIKPIVSRKSLYLACHELGHIVLGKSKTVHEGEFDAEMYARNKMKELGVAVPRASVKRGNAYITQKVRRALRRKVKAIAPRVARFVKLEHNTEVQDA